MIWDLILGLSGPSVQDLMEIVKFVNKCVEVMRCFGRGVEFSDLVVGARLLAEGSELTKHGHVCCDPTYFHPTQLKPNISMATALSRRWIRFQDQVATIKSGERQLLSNQVMAKRNQPLRRQAATD